MPSRPTRRPSPPSPVRCLTVVLVAVALLAAACSDAHTQAQRDWSDTGYDPNVLTLLNPPDLNPVLTALGAAYLTVRPNTSLVFLNQVNASSGKYNRTKSTLTNTQIIQAGASPSLWIDEAGLLKPFANDPRAQGQIVPFAVEPMVLVVRAGNPSHVSGLDAFAAGGPPVGRCSTSVPCGKWAYIWLRADHIQPKFAVKVPEATMLLSEIRAGHAVAGLLFSLSIPPGDITVATVPVASPPAPTFTFSMLAMSTNPLAQQFEKWVATSEQARSIVASYGLLPGTGRDRDLMSPPLDPRSLVCVTGMHRSGTSLATRALELLGVSLGAPEGLLPPGPDNPAGYFENKAIQELDDELLAHLGGSWDQPPTLIDRWAHDPQLDAFRARAAAALVADFGPASAGARTGPLIGFKDPRVSLLLPFWRTVVSVRTTVVVVRAPTEVAASLARRNGIEPPQASLLWLRYVLAAAAHDPDHLLIVQNDFFDQLGPTLIRLADHLGLPRPAPAVEAEVAAHLDIGLQHGSSRRPRRLDQQSGGGPRRTGLERGSTRSGRARPHRDPSVGRRLAATAGREPGPGPSTG